MRRMLRGRGLDDSFQQEESVTVQLPLLLTVVFTIQPRLNDVVKLEDECSWCCEESGVAADVLDIRPDNPISLGRFRGGGTPY